MLEIIYAKNAMYPDGKYYYVCPKCGDKKVFFLHQGQYECSACGEKFPDIRQMIVDPEERLDYYFNKGEDE